MGIVQRQSIKNSLVNYLGIIIGGLSTLFIYPLDWDLYGKIQFSLSTATLCSALFSMGSHSLVNKYFPYFNNYGIKGFLTLVFTYSVINIILALGFLFILRDFVPDLLEFAGFNSERINNNLFIILPIGILMVFISILRPQSYNFGRIVYPDIISNFSIKLVVPAIVLMYYFSLIDYHTAGWILIFYHLLIVLALLLYLKSLNGLDFNFAVFKKVKKNKHVEMIRYMLYGAANHVGDVLIYKIDLIMIGLMLSVTKVGFYSIFLFLSVIIDIPLNAVKRITNPIISAAFENNDITKIQTIYRGASINLLIIGVLLFSFIWLNIYTFFAVMTNGENLVIYKEIFLILSLAKISNMMTDISSSIISYSKHFRIRTLFLFILAIMNITLNYLFIGRFDILGAAISTGISIVIYNFLNIIFISVKYKIKTYYKSHFIIVVFVFTASLLPILFAGIFQSIIFSALISCLYLILFIFVMYKMEVSAEVNNFIDKYRKKILK